MKKIILIMLFVLLSLNLSANEPFVVLEYKSDIMNNKKLNRENLFIKNQNYSVFHKVKSGDSLSGILKKYYGNSGLNMKIIEISIIEINKHAFVRGNPHFLFAGKKIKIPSVNEIMNLVKNEENQSSSINSSRNGHIYFYGN
mgnify:CR=1 FL=1